MPSFRRRASVLDADRVDGSPSPDADRTTDATKARALAEEAEAEAAEAEAIATAARARARALKLRREAEAAEATAVTDAEADVEETAEATVDEAAAVDDDVPRAMPPASGNRRGLVVKVVAMTLASLCTIALIVASALMVIQHRKAVGQQELTAEYMAAGRQSVVTLMSLDFNKAQEDVNRIIDNSTGAFRDDFKNQAPDFIKVAQDSKVITEVTVNSVGVESMTDDAAKVLVSATSRVTNSAGAKQEPRSWRLAVDLQRDGGQIKMSKVEFVP